MKTRYAICAALLVALPSFAWAQSKPAAPKPASTMPQQPSSSGAPAGNLLQDGLSALEARNYEVALKNFNEAFNAGQADGAFYLARMVELGVGVEADPPKARTLYLAAADKGSAKALNRVGLMAFRGEGVLQDYVAARETICKGADLGDADAAFNCAGLLVQGQGGNKDSEKSLALYEKAAATGHIGALNALGVAYRDGDGASKDAAKARDYFERAAAKGNPVGLYELGTIFEAEGQPVKAHLYFNLASARQHPQAPEALQRVSAALSAEDLTKAQAEARAWKATP